MDNIQEDNLCVPPIEPFLVSRRNRTRRGKEHGMTAYLIGDLDVFDMPTIEDYRAKALPLVEKFGGRALALESSPLELENWKSGSMILLEFPNRKAIENLFASAEYAPLAAQRQSAAKSKLVAIDALD